MDLLVTVENITVCPSPTARNLGVTLDNQLCCAANITVVAQSSLDVWNQGLLLNRSLITDTKTWNFQIWIFIQITLF